MKSLLIATAFAGALSGTGGAWAKGYHPIQPIASIKEVKMNKCQSAQVRRAPVKPPLRAEHQPNTASPVYRSTNPANDVYNNGRYMGSDPDPRIREYLKYSKDEY